MWSPRFLKIKESLQASKKVRSHFGAIYDMALNSYRPINNYLFVHWLVGAYILGVKKNS